MTVHDDDAEWLRHVAYGSPEMKARFNAIANRLSPTIAEGVLREALEGAENWVVGPCKGRLGHVTSYDICFPSKPENRGVAVVASVYSGEVVANAILAAIKSVVR